MKQNEGVAPEPETIESQNESQVESPGFEEHDNYYFLQHPAQYYYRYPIQRPLQYVSQYTPQYSAQCPSPISPQSASAQPNSVQLDPVYLNHTQINPTQPNPQLSPSEPTSLYQAALIRMSELNLNEDRTSEPETVTRQNENQDQRETEIPFRFLLRRPPTYSPQYTQRNYPQYPAPYSSQFLSHSVPAQSNPAYLNRSHTNLRHPYPQPYLRRQVSLAERALDGMVEHIVHELPNLLRIEPRGSGRRASQRRYRGLGRNSGSIGRRYNYTKYYRRY